MRALDGWTRRWPRLPAPCARRPRTAALAPALIGRLPSQGNRRRGDRRRTEIPGCARGRRRAADHPTEDARDARIELRARTATISSRASDTVMASLNGRCFIIATNAQHTEMMRDPMGISSAERRSGYPVPSYHSWCERTSSAMCSVGGTTRRMRSPISACVRITTHSRPSSGPSFSRMWSGIASFPTSCSRAAELDPLLLVLRATHELGDRGGQPRDAVQVADDARLALTEHLEQYVDDLAACRAASVSDPARSQHVDHRLAWR